MGLESVREACGIIAVYDVEKPVFDKIFYGLMALQHRGQESVGVAVREEKGKIILGKAMGLVGENLSIEELSFLTGRSGIGHVRYSTVGRSNLTDAQPFSLGDIALAYNGNLVNYGELRQTLTSSGISFTSRCDAEIMLKILACKLKEGYDLFNALSEMASMVEGAYSSICLTDKGEILVFRDPYGFKPLCYGKLNETVIGSSESVAIDMCGGELVSDVQPGEALLISDSGIEKKRFVSCGRRAYCMFEYVYFSRPDSVIEGKSVYDVRLKLGMNLAKTFDGEVDIIVPVPDTSRPAAEGISRVSGLSVAEGLIKNRYVHRTFIMPRETRREDAVKIKLNPLKSVLKNQRVLLIDDSIVRGTTIKNIVHMIKKTGAREVHVRITCPPITSPCFYGIDIATHGELIASKKSVEDVCKTIGAASLEYQTIEGLVEAIGLRREDLCLACLTGEYPTPKAQNLADKMMEKQEFQQNTRYIEFGVVG